MTTNDLASLQEETTPKEDALDSRRSSINAAASPSKLPRLVDLSSATSNMIGKGGPGEKRFVSTPASMPSHKKEVSRCCVTSFLSATTVVIPLHNSNLADLDEWLRTF